MRFGQWAVRTLYGHLVRWTSPGWPSADLRKEGETLDWLAWTLRNHALDDDTALAVRSGTEALFLAAGVAVVRAVDDAEIDGRRQDFLQFALPQPVGPFGRSVSLQLRKFRQSGSKGL